MNIDRHTEELNKQSEETARRWDEQHLFNQSMLSDLKQVFIYLKLISTNMEGISSQIMTMEEISH